MRPIHILNLSFTQLENINTEALNYFNNIQKYLISTMLQVKMMISVGHIEC